MCPAVPVPPNELVVWHPACCQQCHSGLGCVGRERRETVIHVHPGHSSALKHESDLDWKMESLRPRHNLKTKPKQSTTPPPKKPKKPNHYFTPYGIISSKIYIAWCYSPNLLSLSSSSSGFFFLSLYLNWFCVSSVDQFCGQSTQ